MNNDNNDTSVETVEHSPITIEETVDTLLSHYHPEPFRTIPLTIEETK